MKEYSNFNEVLLSEGQKTTLGLDPKKTTSINLVTGEVTSAERAWTAPILGGKDIDTDTFHVKISHEKMIEIGLEPMKPRPSRGEVLKNLKEQFRDNGMFSDSEYISIEMNDAQEWAFRETDARVLVDFRDTDYRKELFGYSFVAKEIADD